MKLLFILCFFILSYSAHASSLKSHEHGSVKLNFALENNTLIIDLEAPADSFLGFEHKAKSTNELKALKQLQDDWNSPSLKFFKFFGNQCSLTSSKLEQVLENGSSHSEVLASASLSCKNKIEKVTEVEIFLIKYFPRIKNLKLEVISSETKSYKIRKSAFKVSL